MSLYVVDKQSDAFTATLWPRTFAELIRWEAGALTIFSPPDLFELRDSFERDGEWPAVVTMPHEPVEHDGHTVPVFEGDVERREWERRRRTRRR